MPSSDSRFVDVLHAMIGERVRINGDNSMLMYLRSVEVDHVVLSPLAEPDEADTDNRFYTRVPLSEVNRVDHGNTVELLWQQMAHATMAAAKAVKGSTQMSDELLANIRKAGLN